jgi:hypothetical protein
VVVWLLGFQKCCSTNQAHCCATSMVVKFVIIVMFIIAKKNECRSTIINIESSTSLLKDFLLKFHIFKLKIPSWNIIAYHLTYNWCSTLLCSYIYFWKKWFGIEIYNFVHFHFFQKYLFNILTSWMICCKYMIIQNTSILEMFISSSF